jgi:hypothetical protein
MTVRISSDYFLKQHYPVGLCNRVSVCFLWDTKWTFKHYLHELHASERSNSSGIMFIDPVRLRYIGHSSVESLHSRLRAKLLLFACIHIVAGKAVSCWTGRNDKHVALSSAWRHRQVTCSIHHVSCNNQTLGRQSWRALKHLLCTTLKRVPSILFRLMQVQTPISHALGSNIFEDECTSSILFNVLCFVW